jgi:hypothetical protein
MEEVLDLYAEAPDPCRPRVCIDEHPYQLIRDVREPLPAQPGQRARYDFEYKREGTCNLFVVFQPEHAWREVVVTERRTKQDFAHLLKRLVDEMFPEAEVIRLVTDNLNTHSTAALYETFAPEDARRIARKLEWHFTPVHGSWLNMVEIEIGILLRQCLNRRLATIELVQHESAIWARTRTAEQRTVEWKFTTAEARQKLQRMYPTLATA